MKDGLQPWEMMREAKDALGIAALQRIYVVGVKSLYKQMKNPDYAGETHKPVIQRVRMMLHDLNNAGASELARAMLNYMAVPLEVHVVPNASARPDKDNMQDECLDDYPCLVALHDAIRSGQDVRAIESLAEEVKREVDETVVAYRNEQEGR
ncbi:hypothetical protein ACI3L3_11850 [Desulfobaculum sp. SPO524]|uniref:hypothetical protein n=1 Tax=Desulfobaculum sp. SPO524 TaxID=3378071 RepID=UPI0038552B2D